MHISVICHIQSFNLFAALVSARALFLPSAAAAENYINHQIQILINEFYNSFRQWKQLTHILMYYITFSFTLLFRNVSCNNDNLPLLSAVHLTAPFDSHIRGAVMTISSFIINVPTADLIG